MHSPARSPAERSVLFQGGCAVVDDAGQPRTLHIDGLSPFTRFRAWRGAPLRPVALVSESQRAPLIVVRPFVFELGALDCAGLYQVALLLLPL